MSSEVSRAALAARMARLRTSLSHHRKTCSGLTRPGGFHGRIQGQKVGLKGNFIDGIDDIGDFGA